MTKAPPCLHCKEKSRLVSGSEVYPHRPDLFSKFFWKCDPCNATCGCHPGTTKPLGFPANKQTRNARSRLHEELLDPLWKSQPKAKRKAARVSVYKYLATALNISPENTHTGMFTLEQCREAWKALKDYRL